MERNNGKSVQMTIRIPVDLWNEINKVAKEEGRSFANILAFMLRKVKGRKA